LSRPSLRDGGLAYVAEPREKVSALFKLRDGFQIVALFYELVRARENILGP
jgi:hypothetical protein